MVFLNIILQSFRYLCCLYITHTLTHVYIETCQIEIYYIYVSENKLVLISPSSYERSPNNDILKKSIGSPIISIFFIVILENTYLYVFRSINTFLFFKLQPNFTDYSPYKLYKTIRLITFFYSYVKKIIIMRNTFLLRGQNIIMDDLCVAVRLRAICSIRSRSKALSWHVASTNIILYV